MKLILKWESEWIGQFTMNEYGNQVEIIIFVMYEWLDEIGISTDLTTAKRIIKAHYESSSAILENGADREGGSIMCMFVGNDQGKN